MDPSADTLPCAGDGHVPDPRTVLHGHDRWHGIAGEFAVVRCAACGLAATEPRLAGDELARYYPGDYYTNTEAAAPGAAPTGIHRLIGELHRRLLERYGPFRDLYAAPPGRLLDVGCGQGALGAQFIARGWSVAGIEPSAAAAAAARRAGLELHVGTLGDAPFAPGGFDGGSLAGLVRRAGLVVRRTWSTSSILSLAGSLQYAVTGRMAWSEGTLYRLGYLTWLLEQPLDRLLGGDCLHMVAVRA
jgi:SAM-dependent methyltransferase